jgi:hypothetical protein
MTNKNNPFEGKAIKYDTIEQLNHLIEIAEGINLEVKFIEESYSTGVFRVNVIHNHYSNYKPDSAFPIVPYSDFIASLEVTTVDPFKGKCLKIVNREDVDNITSIAKKHNIHIVHNDEVIPCWFHYSDYYKGYIFSKHEIKICVDAFSFIYDIESPKKIEAPLPEITITGQSEFNPVILSPKAPTEFTPIRPAHYESGKISPLEFIEDKGLNFHLGNALKYIVRAGKKDPLKLIEDLDKAVFFIIRHDVIFGKRFVSREGTIHSDAFIFDKQLPHLLGEAVRSIVFGEYQEAISCIDKYKSLCQN